MSQTVNVPGVGTLQFPDGMSQADMAAAIQKNFPQIHGKAPRMSPAEWKANLAARQKQAVDQMAEAMPWWQKGLVGMGKAFYDTGQGLGELVGFVSPQQVAQDRATNADANAALMRTGMGKVGNALGYIAESVPLSMAAPEAAVASTAGKLGVMGLTGAANGYIMPYANAKEHAANTVFGGITGPLMFGVGAGTKNALKGLATPEARALMQEGVKLTPGQMLGGMAKRGEDAMMSVPLVGSAIRKGQNRSLDTYSNAVTNRVLNELGMKLPANVRTARAGLIYAQDAVSNAYNGTLNKMTFRVDPQLRNDVSTIFNKYAPKLGKNAGELQTFIQEGLAGRMPKSGAATGQIGHEIQSDLGKQATGLMRKDLQSDRTLGMAVKELQDSVKAAMKRQNSPELNTAYAKAGDAYKNLAKLNKAAAYAGSTDGRVTPNTLMQAVRASDKSFGKKAYNRGRVAMQDLAEAGKNVLPSKVPNSGTIDRLLATGTLGSVGTGAVFGHPAAALGSLGIGAAAHALYSRPGQYLVQKALAPAESPVRNYLAHLAAQRLPQAGSFLGTREMGPVINAPAPPVQPFVVNSPSYGGQ